MHNSAIEKILRFTHIFPRSLKFSLHPHLFLLSCRKFPFGFMPFVHQYYCTIAKPLVKLSTNSFQFYFIYLYSCQLTVSPCREPRETNLPQSKIFRIFSSVEKCKQHEKSKQFLSNVIIYVCISHEKIQKIVRLFFLPFLRVFRCIYDVNECETHFKLSVEKF